MEPDNDVYTGYNPDVLGPCFVCLGPAINNCASCDAELCPVHTRHDTEGVELCPDCYDNLLNDDSDENE